MAKAKRVVRTAVPEVEGHPYQFIYAVTDGLTMKLEEIHHTEKGWYFKYRYIDKMNPAGFESTKFNTVLPLYESELQENFVKKIMIVKVFNNGA